jgi:hypothetical protein
MRLPSGLRLPAKIGGKCTGQAACQQDEPLPPKPQSGLPFTVGGDRC